MIATPATAPPPKVAVAITTRVKPLDDGTVLVRFEPGSAAPIASYAWSFGEPASGEDNRATAARPQHIFHTRGKTYLVTLVATTGKGARARVVLRLPL